MTKIDPTPLIAEAQARETALKVAMRKLERAEKFWLFFVPYTFAVGVLCGVTIMMIVGALQE